MRKKKEKKRKGSRLRKVREVRREDLERTHRLRCPGSGPTDR
jgi:hypothetical protein